jgi:predicted protein tyrosine phosphatase
MADDLEPTPEAMSAAAAQMQGPRAAAATNALADPDKAADAYNLGKATGVPAEVIEPRLDAFKAQLKQRTAGDLAANNINLGQFLVTSDMHAKATSDDLGQLDSVSKSLDGVGQPGLWQRFMDTLHSTVTRPMSEIGESFRSGYSEQNDQMQQDLTDLKNYSQSPAWQYGAYPIAYLAATSLGTISSLAGGGLDAMQTALGQGLSGLGVPESDKLARDVRGMVEYGMMGAHPDLTMGGAPKELNDMAEAAAKAVPYVKAKEPMPVGLHPLIDDVKKEELKTDTDNLKEAFKESLKSATRERTPDLFREFVAQHVGEDSVGISADTMSALYPKEPEVGDGPFGFVKDLPEQWRTMMVTGADVKVPIADMMTYLDPETFRQIEPGLRPREEGFTANEVEAEKAQPVGEGEAQPAEQPPPGETPLLAEPKAIDMSKRQGQQYARLIGEQQEKAATKILAQSAKAEAMRQAPEWRANREKEISGIIDEMSNDPKFIADAGIRRGEIPKIQSSELTPEQKELLHRSYYGKDGFPPDIVAQMTGHGSGEELVGDLMDLHRARMAENAKPDDFLRSVINREADARMEQKYGDFGENVLSAAKEQALSPGNLDLMHAELEYLAAEHGLQMPYTKQGLAATAREEIARTPMGSLSSARFMTSAARAAGRVESALLDGDATKAFQARQEKWANMVFAREAKGVEDLKAKFDKIVGRYGKMTADSIPDSYAKDWVNQIHGLMSAYGLKLRRKVPGVLESMAMDGSDNLQKFVAEKTWSPDGFATRDIPAPEWVYSTQAAKSVPSMTVEEFREFHGLMSALDVGAREDGKVLVRGEKMDYVEQRDKLIGQLKDWAEGHVVPDPGAVKHLVKSADAGLRNLESVFNRFDKLMPGEWYETFTRQFSDAAAYEDNLRREFEGKLQDAIGDVKLDLDREVKQDFWQDPRTQRPFARFTRKNLMGVLSNIGNESNLNKLAKGYGKDPKDVMNWVFANTTPEERQMISRIGGVWNDLFDRANTMHHQLTGVAVDKVPLMDIVAPEGTIPGWYQPLMSDSRLKGYRQGAGSPGVYGESPTGFYRATTNQAWSKQRTGAVYPVALDLDAIPIRMKQMIHDIATRPAVIQLSKFMYDDKFTQAIADHMGREYADLMVPFLRDFAGSTNYVSPVARTFGEAVSALTHNMVSTFIDMNPATIGKHGLTVMFNSMLANEKELGYNGRDFLREFTGLMSMDEKTGETNWAASNKFPEIARRMERYEQMVRRAGAEFTLSGENTTLKSMSTYMQWIGHAPIGFGDLISSKATANAAYRNAIARGESEGSAVALADRAVRLTHGSTVATNKPEVMRSRNALAKTFSVLYTTFNHIYNRQYDTVADMMDEFKMLGKGQFSAAAERAPVVVGKVLSYYVMPVLIEQMLTPYTNKQHEAWGTWLAKFVGAAVGTPIVGARDLVYSMLNHQAPTFGIAGDIGKAAYNPIEDMVSKKRFTKPWVGRFMKDMTVASGVFMGIGSATLGNMEKYITDYFLGLEHPRGPWDWMTGLRYGSNKNHSRSAAQWLKEETGL